MSKSVSIRGHVTDQGKLTLFNKEVLTRWLADNKEKNVLIEIEVKKAKRSLPQNNYYFGVVVPMIKSAMNEYGNDFTTEEAHEFLKSQFNYKEVEITDGHYINVPRSTTKLDTTGFQEYVLKIQQFASEMLGIIIPEPNEQLNYFSQ